MWSKQGFTLIETLVASAVLVIFIMAVLTIMQTAVAGLGEAKVRNVAIQLAQDQLEMARNLAYDQVGTEGGIPPGDLNPNREIQKLGTTFRVLTSVLYIDDAFDGQAPTDLLPTDYKRVRVQVSWQGAFTSKAPVILMTDVAPPGMESNIGGGTLSILVFNAQGIAVDSAKVTIRALSLSPPVNVETYTDAEGKVMIPGAPICIGCYRIEVSKEGYSSDRTYGTDEVDNPAKPHLSVLQSQITNISFAIDSLATLQITATRPKTSGYAPFAGVALTVTGTKEIGRTIADEPVYKVNQVAVTGTGGVVTVPNLEWDTYTISLPSSSSVDLAGSWPFNPVTVNPGQTTPLKVVVDGATPNSLLVQLENNSLLPLDSAQIQISQPGFLATASAGLPNTGDWSQAFFKGLTGGSYSISINSTGYETATASVTVSGDRAELFVLSPSGP